MGRQRSYTIEAFTDGRRFQNNNGIDRLLNRHHHRRDLELAISNQPQYIYLARNRQEIIGLAASLLESDHKEATLILYVHPKWRRRGIASELLKRTVNQVCRDGLSPKFIAFSPSDDTSLAQFLTQFGLRYLYSDYYMTYQSRRPLDIPDLPAHVEIVAYQDRYYEDMVKLRNLGVNDDQALKGLPIRPLFRSDDLSYRQWMQAQRHNSFMLLVNGRIRGFIMAATDGEIRSVVVDPSERGQGYAKLLMKHAIQYQIDHKRAEIYLWVGQKNETARHIYTKLGFAIEERYDCSFGDIIL